MIRIPYNIRLVTATDVAYYDRRFKNKIRTKTKIGLFKWMLQTKFKPTVIAGKNYKTENIALKKKYI